MKFTLLKEWFVSFLRSRRVTRHFRRLTLLDTISHSQPNTNISSVQNKALTAAAKSDVPQLLNSLNSSISGLTFDQVSEIRAKVGTNDVEHEAPLTWFQHIWLCYKNPFNLLLTLLAIISFLTDDMQATVVIGTMVVLSTLLRYWQETKSNKAADSLKAMVSNTATVKRLFNNADDLHRPVSSLATDSTIEVPITELVPGDIIQLSAGDMIPADSRIITAKDLFVAQSAMTGESMPVEKFTVLADLNAVNPLDLTNIVFMGTNVVSGTATAVVLTTGKNTYFGALATHVTKAEREPTSFQLGVNQISWVLIRFMLLMVPIVLFINGLTKGDWFEAMLFALSIAVGLTPEMLPLIATSTLAKGAIVLSRQKVIVKRLDAIQNFGAMDILCTDKTGTLTQDKIVLAHHTDVTGEESFIVLEKAYLNSYYQTGLKNLLDVAVLEHFNNQGIINPANHYQKVDEIPFDFQRRRMSVVVADSKGKHEIITKGAVEEIISLCTHVQQGESIEPMSNIWLDKICQDTAALNAEGLRVVAVAAKIMPHGKTTYSIEDENELTLIGYIAFLDPPKESAAPAIKALYEHGVAIKVLTGDNAAVALKVCRDVGMPINLQQILLGSDIETMEDAELSKTLETTQVYAKLTPGHKARIVRLLKENGHVVGFMGDGINDAPALRTADIGISVDTAVDIAKEAADIILLEKSLMVLEQGVLEGRRIFANMLKYIKMTASSNFGNVFSVLVASAFIPFLPMLPMHLLVQNLLYDISQVAIPFDKVDEELLQKPQKWQPSEVGRFMVFFGPISSIFDILTFAMMWFVFGANTPEQQTLFQSGWFIVGLLTQTLIVHMIRTAKIPFIQSRAAAPLIFMTITIMLIGIFLPMGPWASYFKLEALPGLYFVFLPFILLAYMVLTQLLKNIYVKRYGWQ